jgi:hypothetical protein
VRSVVARLAEAQFSDSSVVWEYEEQDLARLETIKERLDAGDFAWQKEIGDAFDVSKQMAGKYVEKGVRVGPPNAGGAADGQVPH